MANEEGRGWTLHRRPVGRRADALRETFRVKSPLSTKGRAARSPNPESPLEEKTSSLMDIILEEK